MTEKEWLAQASLRLRDELDDYLNEYDEARITYRVLIDKAASAIDASLSRVYDRGFTAGINAADLDGDSVEEEIEFDLDEDEGEEHP